jgi:hypothetical protein
MVTEACFAQRKPTPPLVPPCPAGGEGFPEPACVSSFVHLSLESPRYSVFVNVFGTDHVVFLDKQDLSFNGGRGQPLGK